MMEGGLGKEKSRATRCPDSPTADASTPQWKDCFGSNETIPPHQIHRNNHYMDTRKPLLELKDVPPPPQHPPSPHLSKPLPLRPLPLPPPPPPCFLAPPHLSQDCQQQQQLPPEGASPKVSHCVYCSTAGRGLLGGGGDAGGSSSSIAGVVSLCRALCSMGDPICSSSGSIRSGTCSVVSSVHPCQQTLSCNTRGQVPESVLRLGCTPQLHSPVAIAQPLSSHNCLPCCSGLLHTCSAAPSPCSQASSFPPSVSSLPASVHDSCLVSSGFYTCDVGCNSSARRSQRSAHGDQTTATAVTTTTSTARFFSNPIHLNVERTACVKGAHCCLDYLKPVNGVTSDTDEVWPKVCVPQTASLPVPVCNGCGTSSDAMALWPNTSCGTSYKYGSPESGGCENIPPVGVFWDIENCNVPSGRSAGAVVQRIRSHFFKGHREAEFICVCDISKESKAVIQELNNCQVTVAHINATAKNAADDKLRQSLRRFAETHTAPATVVLVSSDVNFASELSDLRHRHGFQVILVHGSHTSSALLQHAHLHVAFQEITADLPQRPLDLTEDLTNVEAKPRMGQQQVEKVHMLNSSHQTNGEMSALEHLSKPGFTKESGCRRREVSLPPNRTAPLVDKGDKNFQISTPLAFTRLNLHRSFSPVGTSQGSWSSRSASPSLSSRSSPLLAAPRSPNGRAEPFLEGAEVQVANLDYRMSRKDLQQTLRDTFSRFGQVHSVELSPHTDYQLKAAVQMSSLQQAISAVSGLHRFKIGSKRVQVSLVTGGSNKSLSLEIISILQDSPANCLPVFKFLEIYEKKYSRKIAVSDLYKLPDLVSVREQGGSRLVCLLPHSQIRQSPLGSSPSQEGSSSLNGSPVVFEELEYHNPVCEQHYSKQNFSEADFDPESYKIPFVVMSLSTLASELNHLLESHGGTLPLLSFPDCYAAEFSPLILGSEMTEGAVPLEHLITCVPTVTIVIAQNGFKVIKWLHSRPPAHISEPWIQRCKSPVGNPQLIQFSREIIDLLKGQPSCIMPISKFIPAYHHHFAKQCRVSDYGFSKLLELLEAVPHVLQILGMGTKRLLTLTHRAQVKRFTQDLLKLLKFQASKRVAVKDFMQAYHWCFSRDWRVTDYGTCDLMDLLAEIPDTTITISHQSSDTVISVPKRERTTEEVERTKQFGKEVVDLLRHQPHCRMPFSKFIPTYHHHFGRQCKLSYYGFTKLVELFEAIPDILQLLECGEEKVLALTEVERIKALAAQLVKVLRAQKNYSLPVSQLLTEYSRTFGYSLRLQDFDTPSLSTLLAKLSHVVKVVDSAEGREVQLINRKSLRTLTYQLLALLMSQETDQLPKGMKVEELSQRYQAVHGSPLNPCEYGFLSLSELLKSLPNLMQLYHEDNEENGKAGDEYVRLTRLFQFARNVRALLHTYHYNQIFLTEFQGAYSKFMGSSLEPRSYECVSVDDLLNAIPQVVWIKGHGHKRIIVLKNDMKAKASSSVPSSPHPAGSPRDSPVSGATSGTQSPGMESREKEVSDQGVEWSEWKGLIFMMLWFRRGRIFEIVWTMLQSRSCSASRPRWTCCVDLYRPACRHLSSTPIPSPPTRWTLFTLKDSQLLGRQQKVVNVKPPQMEVPIQLRPLAERKTFLPAELFLPLSPWTVPAEEPHGAGYAWLPTSHSRPDLLTLLLPIRSDPQPSPPAVHLHRGAAADVEPLKASV
ncbi:meiosis regulator and mRNA stability factor 1 isoform X4 [Oryzias latipes]|uniref:meiosis regulator and mRNA stability factor 1 isoform X4 n=1 Tax=Oryzias latipes TaxID=8090 RepID=UPI000CE1E329|nr:meiosis regulator and mRNA stability factor 1 isoform X4 [Oryzias latipes]